jgi:dolichol kinase
MLLIEWICASGLPILLCIIILVDGTGDDFILMPTTCAGSDNVIEDSLHGPLSALVTTSFLSLIAILLFGDARDDDNNCGHRRQCNNRGTGIVMGSNLVPLHYMAFLLSLPRGGRNEDECVSCQPGVTMITNNDQYTSRTGRVFYHLEFASMGGLAFTLSFLCMKWSRYNYRKYNRRSPNGVNGAVKNNGSCADRPVLKNEQSIRFANSMGICWKIYASLLVFHSTRCASSYDCDYTTLILGSIHIVLILLYDKKPATMKQDENPKIQDASWQVAFTPGEWMVVSTLITSLVGEYILQHSGIRNSSTVVKSPFDNSLPIHLTVAYAGFVGCLAGVTLCSFLKKLLSLSPFLLDNLRNIDKCMVGVAASLCVVVVVTFGFLETALNSQLNKSSLYCGPEPSTCANSSVIFNNSRIPRSAKWLFEFLSSNVDVSTCAGPVSIVRSMFLVYWATVLSIGIPMASNLTSWINILDESINNGKNVNYSNNRHGRTRRKRVIIARKYFHFLAILLFTPIVCFDPDMMALSYAIAIALLIVVEMVRGWLVSDSDKEGTFNRSSYKSSWNRFYMAFLDEKDSSAAEGGLAVTHIALIIGCALPLLANQLLQQMRRSSAAGWSPSRLAVDMWSSSDDTFLAQLPFFGLVVLGVGDSVGAICGINFGRHNWPGGSTRTLEGSVCMFLSMMFVSLLNSTANCNYTFQLSVTMLAMTLFEASTSQIDNLCLPIAGSTLVLLLAAHTENRDLQGEDFSRPRYF